MVNQLLDLQNLNTENNEADGEVGPMRDNNNKTGNAPARKNYDKNKYENCNLG